MFTCTSQSLPNTVRRHKTEKSENTLCIDIRSHVCLWTEVVGSLQRFDPDMRPEATRKWKWSRLSSALMFRSAFSNLVVLSSWQFSMNQMSTVICVDYVIYVSCVLLLLTCARVQGTENSWLLADMFHDQSGFPYGKHGAVLVINPTNTDIGDADGSYTEWSRKTVQSLMHRHFATVCIRITRCSPKRSEINR